MTSSLKEYVVGTEDEKGGTKTVTVLAESADDAEARILKMGYHSVSWTMPEN